MRNNSYITDIDIVIVSGRRPELLAQTLATFSRQVFENFSIYDVHVNIDPVFGNDDDHRKTIDVVRYFFPRANIHSPEIASFGEAVKSLWSRLGERLTFHLEDDWIALEKIGPADLGALLTNEYYALAPTSRSLPPPSKKRDFVMLAEKKRIWGPVKRKTWFYAMGTAPKFIDGQLAREISSHMEPNLDPEKQMLKGFNSEIFNLLQSKRCGYLFPKKQSYMIEDIGRKWREVRQIEKRVENGKSIWLEMK